VGRSPDAGIRLRAPEVSREHARVVAAGGGFALEDRSKNGLCVNGRRVRGRAPIAVGDEVELGGVRLRIVDGPSPLHHDPDPGPVRAPSHRLPLLAAAGLLLAVAVLALAL
jgi:pSer/pThr/pTyr-binding forkhead associated (FHA) protein